MQNTIPAAGEAMPEKLVPSPRLDEALSFVTVNKGKGGGYNYWANVPAGESYTEDCATGCALAEELMAFSAKYPNYGNASLLGPIMLAMEANGATKGQKIAFWNTINKFAMVGACIDEMGAKLLKPEDPKDKAYRLASELAHTLTDYAEGMFKAVVYPANVQQGVYFSVLNLPTATDPLSVAISAFRDGLARMNAIPNEDITQENEERLIAETYGPPIDVLYEWDKPAITRKGAIDALI